MFRFIAAVLGFLAAFAVIDTGRAAQDSPSQGKPAEQVQLSYSAWTRTCTREVDAGGKQICVTVKTGRIESGQPVVTAILVEREGESRKTLRVVLPMGMQMAHGTRIIVDSNTPLQSAYEFCTTEGCASDYDLTPDLASQFRRGKNLVVQAINANSAPLTLPLPLADFNKALDGNATDWGSLDDQRKKIVTSLLGIKNEAGQSIVNPTLIYAPWTKFCLRGQDANAKLVCFTGKDGRIESGQPLIAAVLIEPEGETKKVMRVTLPLGVQLTDGTRVTVDGNAPLASPYVICFANGCMSDYEVTPALLASLRNGRSLSVQGTFNTGRAVTLALPLAEFNAAYSGPPTDPKVFEAAQKKLQEELAQRAAAVRARAQQNPSGQNPPGDVVAAARPPGPATPAPSSPRPAAVPFGRRVALVIGNSAYQHAPTLPNPRRDAVMVADALRQANFQSVTLQNDLGREQLVNALRDFARLAEGADWAVVYYAGHGMEVAGVNYLVPVDARISTDRDINLEAVSMDQVLNSAERARKLRLVLLDACRDNPFADQMKRTMTTVSRSVSRGLAQMEPDPGTLVVFAAKHGETAMDGDAQNSPFALAFVRNIKTPGVEVRRLFDNVRDDVMEMTGHQQQPYSYGSISGRQDFYFTAAN
jgi:invasion protein IalB